jgi:protein-S-isoprenylcysteine O-methyltransferase Ste14
VPELALACYALYGAVAFGLRILLQLRATGSTGVRGITGRPGSVEWFAGLGFILGIALAVIAAARQADGEAEPIEALDARGVQVAGLVLFAVGLAATFYAQLAMGRSWRIGVDETERTELVTGGPFRLVRNPIYAAMLPAFAGLALMTPNPLALVALAILFVALQLQVRVVEEPHLRRVHGDEYVDYASRVGRFVPGLGRIRQ